MNHQLEIGRHDYGGLGVTACPEWHNSVVFITWIEENISLRPERRYPGGCLACTLGRVDNDKNQKIFESRFRRSENPILAAPEAPDNPGLAFCRPEHKIRDLSAQRAGGKIEMAPPEISPGTASQLHSLSHLANRVKGRRAMMSQPYVDGIADTVPHLIASSRPVGQIVADENTLSVSVVCPDRWFLGDVAVVTSRDGHAFAGQVADLDVCTGEVTIKLPGS